MKKPLIIAGAIVAIGAIAYLAILYRNLNSRANEDRQKLNDLIAQNQAATQAQPTQPASAPVLQVPTDAIFSVRADSFSPTSPTGGRIKDGGPGGLTGTVFNARINPPRDGGGFLFKDQPDNAADNLQNRISFGNRIPAFPLNDFTISIWFIPSNSKALIGSCQDELWFRGWYITPNTFWWSHIAGRASGAVGREIVQLQYETKIGQWNHLVITRLANTVTATINGRRDKINTSFPTTSLPIYSYGLTVGNVKADNGRYAHWIPYSGIIEDISIFNRILSAEEISQLYAAGKQRLQLQ